MTARKSNSKENVWLLYLFFSKMYQPPTAVAWESKTAVFESLRRYTTGVTAAVTCFPGPSNEERSFPSSFLTCCGEGGRQTLFACFRAVVHPSSLESCHITNCEYVFVEQSTLLVFRNRKWNVLRVWQCTHFIVVVDIPLLSFYEKNSYLQGNSVQCCPTSLPLFPFLILRSVLECHSSFS